MIETLISLLDLSGVFVFALSGALAAVEKKMDLLGMLVLAIVTAVGGGTLRSLFIGDFPIPFFRDPNYLITCIAATALVFWAHSVFQKLKKPIIVCDAMGLGLFMALGMSIAFQHELAWWASLLMGVVTASFGGVIRDILSARVPLIFRSDFYASACLIGGGVYLLLQDLQLPDQAVILITAASVFLLRILGVILKWRVPRVKEQG